MNKHLWEIDHPYYCKIENYFSNDSVSHHDTWDSFHECEDDEDMDLNLIFRWDWEIDHEDFDDEIDDSNDEKFDNNHVLKLFYMTQRKGIFRTVIIKVKKEDEEKIKKFLKPRWRKMKKLWEGIS